MDRRNEPQPASDEEITAMFRTRDERAPEFAMQKYGRLMLAAAERVLHSPQDSEECVDDALLSLWNAFPDYGEINLPALLAVSARRAALNRFNSDLRRQGAAEGCFCEKVCRRISPICSASPPEREMRL